MAGTSSFNQEFGNVVESGQLLASVDESKQDRFQAKFREVKEQTEWNRENFDDNVEKVVNIVETVDELITDAQSRYAQIVGAGGNQSKFQQVISDYGENQFQKLREKDVGSNKTPTLHELHSWEREARELVEKILEWKEYQFALVMVGMEKLSTIAEQLRTDYQQSTHMKYLDETFDGKFEDKIKARDERLRRERQEVLADLEARMRQLEGLVSGMGQAPGTVQRNGSEDSMGSEGPSELDELPEEGEYGEDGDDGPRYRLKGKDLEVQYNILQELVENEDVDDMTQEEIAELTDLTTEGVFRQDGGLVARISERYDTTLGLR